MHRGRLLFGAIAPNQAREKAGRTYHGRHSGWYDKRLFEVEDRVALAAVATGGSPPSSIPVARAVSDSAPRASARRLAVAAWIVLVRQSAYLRP